MIELAIGQITANELHSSLYLYRMHVVTRVQVGQLLTIQLHPSHECAQSVDRTDKLVALKVSVMDAVLYLLIWT
ncbi:hypothetical protein D3C75_1061050 [compost metagenome]